MTDYVKNTKSNIERTVLTVISWILINTFSKLCTLPWKIFTHLSLGAKGRTSQIRTTCTDKRRSKHMPEKRDWRSLFFPLRKKITGVVHGVWEKVRSLRTETESGHGVTVPVHVVHQLVLSQVPHLQRTNIHQRKRRFRYLGWMVDSLNFLFLNGDNNQAMTNSRASLVTLMSLSMPPDRIWSLVSLKVTASTW